MNKIQDFQKRLIFKTEELVSKEIKVLAQEEDILRIRNEIKNRPGIKEANQLSVIQQQVKNRTRTIKVHTLNF